MSDDVDIFTRQMLGVVAAQVAGAADVLHGLLTAVATYAVLEHPGAVTDLKLDLERISAELDSIAVDLKKAAGE